MEETGRARRNDDQPLGGLCKRIFDVAIACIALLVLVPPTTIAAVILRLQIGSPVFFRQSRRGFGGRVFKCYKLRTMATGADEALREVLTNSETARAEWQAREKLSNDPRVASRFAHFVRHFHIDEVPQLYNVAKGDMSVVGPRPMPLGEERRRMASDLALYDLARPGMTGSWQINRSAHESYDVRRRLDNEYVQSWSMLKDIGLIFATVGYFGRLALRFKRT